MQKALLTKWLISPEVNAEIERLIPIINEKLSHTSVMRSKNAKGPRRIQQAAAKRTVAGWIISESKLNFHGVCECPAASCAWEAEEAFANRLLAKNKAVKVQGRQGRPIGIGVEHDASLVRFKAEVA